MSSTRPLASSRSYGRASAVPGGGLGGAGQREGRVATTRASADRRGRRSRSPCRSRRWRRPPAHAAGWSRRPPAGCRATLWRSTECCADSGFVTRTRPSTGGLLRLVGRGAVIARREPLDRLPARRGRTSPSRSGRPRRAPSRMRVADLDRVRADTAGIGVCGRIGWDLLVPVDPGDLLDDVGLDREVPTPGRHRRLDDSRRPRRRPAVAPRRRRRWSDPRRRLVPWRSRPGQEVALLGRSPSSVPSRRFVRAGRKATCGTVGLLAGPSPRRLARRSLRPTRSGAASSGPRRSGRAATPGPSRSAGSRPSAARSGRPTGGC